MRGLRQRNFSRGTGNFNRGSSEPRPKPQTLGVAAANSCTQPRRSDVRFRGQSGHDVLILSFSAFDQSGQLAIDRGAGVISAPQPATQGGSFFAISGGRLGEPPKVT